MITVNKLSLTMKKSGLPLIQALSCTLNRGDKIAVIGHEGTGKSTLLKLLNNTFLPHIEMQGEVVLRGKIGYLEQDIKTVWSDTSLYDYFLKENPDDEFDPELAERFGDLNRILDRLDFDKELFDESAPVSRYSGGEVVKLGLAKLMMHETEILLLDEPTNDLDFDTILFMEKFIKETEKAVLFVSHDERLLENTATGIIHLQRTHKNTKAKSYFERMDYASYKHYRLQQHESAMMRARKERADHKKKLEKFRRIYQSVEHLQNETVRNPSAARLLAKKMKSLKSQEHRYDKEASEFTPIPEREPNIDLYFEAASALPDGRTVLDFALPELTVDDRVLSRNIKLIVKGPQKIAIVGRNGIGKTTLLKALVTAIEPDKALRVGYMPQDYADTNTEIDVLTFLGAHQEKKKEEKARKMLGSLNFERSEMEACTDALSGGQRAKLYLLKMVLEDCNVLILDEPTRNLSPLSAPEVRELLLRYPGAIIAVTHDRSFIETVFDHILILKPEGLTEY